MKNVNRVKACWPEPIPAWVLVLAEACDKESQSKVSRKISYSAPTVNAVLGNRYAGDLSAVEKAVKGGLMEVTVQCPVMGDLAMHVCQENQRAPFSSANSMRVKLFKACRSGCPHSRHTKGEA